MHFYYLRENMTKQSTKKSEVKAIAEAYQVAIAMMSNKHLVVDYPITRCDTTEEVDGRHRSKD